MQITVNAPGARTIAEARPMILDGKRVYVTVGGGTASLFIGGRIVAEQASEDMTAKAAQDWAISYVEAQETELEAQYAEAVQSVQDAGALLLKQADKLEAKAQPGRYRHVGMRGKVTWLADTDPRHPLLAHRTLRQQALRLMAWSAKDEAGYARYVDNGLADTDGHFAPLSRDAWKGTLGA